MDLSDLIEVPAIMPALKANSKKQLLQLLAEKAAAITGLPEREIFDTILQRERLGSTGVGNGIAIPHGKLAGVKRITGVFARLETPVDFEALDDQPVDLVFLLLAPEGAGADHLKALSRIARVLRDADTVAKIRGTKRRGRDPRASCRRHAGLARRLKRSSGINHHKGGPRPPFRDLQWPAVASVDSHRGEVVLQGAGQSAVALVGQQDRLAVGGKQRPQLSCRARSRGRPGNLPFRSSLDISRR